MMGNEMSFNLRICLCAFLIFLGVTEAARAQAPRQLYNKTIQLNWTTLVNETDPNGQSKNVAVAVNHTIYVSSAGRLFERASRTTQKASKQTENAPGAKQNAGGEATGLSFQGNRLIGNTAFGQGARNFTVTFDPGYSSCTVSVVFGRDSGGLKRKGVDGVMRTINSMKSSGETCSIREGNPFS
jgi:hypothetical protein